MHFVVPPVKIPPKSRNVMPARGSLPPLQDGTKTGYSSWEWRQSVRIRSGPAPRTYSHKTVVLCRLSIKTITSLGAVAERHVSILLPRLGGEAVTPRAGAKNRLQPRGGRQRPLQINFLARCREITGQGFNLGKSASPFLQIGTTRQTHLRFPG